MNPARPTLCDQIAHFARTAHDSVAAADATRAVTYLELNQRTRRLANILRSRGVGTNSIVLLLLPQSLMMIEAIVAIWQAGAAFLPVDPSSPPSWRTRTVQASGARICLTTSDTIDLPGVERLNLDLMDLDVGELPVDLPAPGLDDISHVMRTSGSTGTPKLAACGHGGMVDLLFAIRAELRGLGPGAVFLQITSLYFDSALVEILAALGTGSRLEISNGLPSLAEVINTKAITHASMVAPLVRTLDPAGVPGLRVVISIAAVCWTETARQWSGRVQFVNAYGPTETTVVSNMYTVDPDNLPTSAAVPIGRAITGARVYILDDDLAPVPDGERGEICIGGSIVGRGYLGQAEETARRFVADPFGAPGDRLYLSGDIGTRTPDGVVEFVGRKDLQVKIRGFRVEPGEVEGALAELPEVLDAVVIADPRIDSGRLIGYVRIVPDCGITGREIRAALRAVVPAHLIPSVVTIVDIWPLLYNGKIDRAKLPLPR